MAHYLDFKGTTSREMYWKFVASVFLLWIIMGILIGDGSAPYDWDAIVYLFSIIPLISATVRRIRDAGFNPWWGLLLAGPGTQVIVIIMAMFRTHTQQNERRQTYIPNPELNQNIELLQEQIVQLGVEISRLQREHSPSQMNDENRHGTSNVRGSNYEESMPRATLETVGELRHVDFLQSLPLEVHADSVIHDNSSLASDKYQCDVDWLKGTMTFPDGARYEGDWESGEFHGKGTYTFPDGRRYEGDFESNKFHGKGTMTFPDGARYEGNWESDKFHGKGTMTYPDGARYEGDFESGNRHGKGTMTFSDGARYEGDWESNKFHGKGTMTYPDGARYEGDWESDKFHGKGTYTFPDGSQLEGHWIHGAEMGTFIFTSADGSQAYVEYDLGEMVSTPRTYLDPRGPWKDFR